MSYLEYRAWRTKKELKMANALITRSVIAKEALMQLENKPLSSQTTSTANTKGIRPGDTASIRQTGEIGNGWQPSIQDVTESSTPFVINKRKHAGRSPLKT